MRYTDSANYMTSIADFGVLPVVVNLPGRIAQMQLCEFCDVIPGNVVQQYADLVGRVIYRPVRPR